MARRFRYLLISAAVLLMSATSPSAALADGDFDDNPGAGSTGSGYKATVDVDYSGDAAPHGGGHVRTKVAVQCWWTAAPGPNTDPVAMEKYYADGLLDITLSGLYGGRSWAMQNHGGGYVGIERSVFQEEADGAKDKTDWGKEWYVGVCRDGVGTDVYLDNFQGYYRDIEYNNSQLVGGGIAMGAFPVGNPPAPRVAPEDLALAARDAMVLPVPAVERNPKIKSADDATLVGFDTWFWVTDQDSIGGTGGTRTIRAQVGAVWAEVVATTRGLSVSSPAGSSFCTTKAATTAWSTGASGGCVVQFVKASVAYPKGYPVTSSVTWQADWTGSGNTGGDLDPLTRDDTVNIPVAEVQTSIVN